MFKLLKIENGSRINVPEPTIIKVSDLTHYRPGRVYYRLEDDSVQTTRPEEYASKPFMPLEESAPTGGSARKIQCFFITEHMIFEAKFIGDVSSVYEGASVCLSTTGGGGLTHCTATGGLDAEVIDVSRAAEGFVTLKFMFPEPITI